MRILRTWRALRREGRGLSLLAVARGWSCPPTSDLRVVLTVRVEVAVGAVVAHAVVAADALLTVEAHDLLHEPRLLALDLVLEGVVHRRTERGLDVGVGVVRGWRRVVAPVVCDVLGHAPSPGRRP
jgi:hypothetical protein